MASIVVFSTAEISEDSAPLQLLLPNYMWAPAPTAGTFKYKALKKLNIEKLGKKWLYIPGIQ